MSTNTFDISNEMEISTEQLAAMLSDGFDDEPEVKKSRTPESVEDIAGDMPVRDEFGTEFNFSDIVDDENEEEADEDFDDASEYRDAEEFDDDKVYLIGEEKYEVGQIEKAVMAYKDIASYHNSVMEHQKGLEAAEEHFNKLQTLAYGQIDAAIDYYQSIIDNPATNDTDYRAAMREIRNGEAKKREIEQAYSESREIMNQRKREAEAMNAMTVRNELVHNYGWTNDDMSTVANYITENQMIIDSKLVDSKLMLALRKAAMFDAGKNKAKLDAESKVVTALRGKPITKAAPVADSSESDAKKRKAKAQAMRDELKAGDMFKYLVD